MVKQVETSFHGFSTTRKDCSGPDGILNKPVCITIRGLQQAVAHTTEAGYIEVQHVEELLPANCPHSRHLAYDDERYVCTLSNPTITCLLWSKLIKTIATISSDGNIDQKPSNT